MTHKQIYIEREGGGTHTHTHTHKERDRERGVSDRESDVGRDSEGGINKVERGFERQGVREGDTHTHRGCEREGGNTHTHRSNERERDTIPRR